MEAIKQQVNENQTAKTTIHVNVTQTRNKKVQTKKNRFIINRHQLVILVITTTTL